MTSGPGAFGDDRLAARLAAACHDTDPALDASALVAAVNAMAPAPLAFTHVSTRRGWHRPGGVVGPDGARVADHLDPWLDAASGGDVGVLAGRVGDAGLQITRLVGETLILVAPTGAAARDFVQLEIERLQEVIERPLLPPGPLPETIDEIRDPSPTPPCAPGAPPIGVARYRYRRITDIARLAPVLAGQSQSGRRVVRFLADWDASSAGRADRFSHRWVLTLIPYTDRFGDHLLEARPRPAARIDHPAIPRDDHGRHTALWRRLQAYDKAAGYPMAWYFALVANQGVPHEVALTVDLDLSEQDAYLPTRDAALIRGWVADPYRV